MRRALVVVAVVWASAALAQGRPWIAADLSGSRFEGCSLTRSAVVGGQWLVGFFDGVAMQQTSVRNTSLQDAVLADVNLAQAKGERLDLSGVELRASNLNRLSLIDCRGDEATFTGLTLTRPKLSNAKLTDVAFSRGQFSGKLEGVELPKISFQRCSGGEMTLDDVDFRDVSLEGSSVYRLQVDGLDIGSGAQFEDVRARSSRWRNIDLNSADLERVDLRGARLYNCDLQGLSGDRCNLSNARLTNCDIRGLVINGHNIEELIRDAER